MRRRRRGAVECLVDSIWTAAVLSSHCSSRFEGRERERVRGRERVLRPLTRKYYDGKFSSIRVQIKISLRFLYAKKPDTDEMCGGLRSLDLKIFHEFECGSGPF